ncbi:MAG TPA: trehalase family glycosidase, partial [Polyangia bacterium]|nr:trehalase family glycosidase [Polyangia bacterium]
EPSAVHSLVDQALPAAARATLDLQPLPAGTAPPPALLFLPKPYVVPGGRFNEMYGWDSYFILLGLLRDGETQRAQDLVDDFLYEVTHYGGVLNANRSYYLTRSQPPFLAAMVLALFRVTQDKAWLAQTRPALQATWTHWTSPPHAFPGLALSRYWDHGEGPAPEVVAGERDAQGRTHYDRVREAFRQAFRQTPGDPEIARYYDAATDALTPLFYKGDRSMRESGFDPSQRFGHFGADVIRLAPVCLNTLLARFAGDLAAIEDVLDPGPAADLWRQRQRERARAIDEHLWDEAAGLYFDLDVETGQPRAYPFATTFWPLAMGLASPHQAGRVRANLPLFERPGGILTSTVVTGNQWDAPFGWAPLQLFVVDGLRRYGFATDGQRVARAFLSMLAEDLERRGALVEKYDVERRTSETGGLLRYGYGSNEVGFGWTNGVALELLAGL